MTPHLFVNPCTKPGWSLGAWSVLVGGATCSAPCDGAAGVCPACWGWSCLAPPAPGPVNSPLCCFHLLSYNTFSSYQKDPHKLSEQQEALCDGQNPLPVYVSVCVRDSYSTNDFKGKDVVLDPLRLKLAAEFLSSLFSSWKHLEKTILMC